MKIARLLALCFLLTVLPLLAQTGIQLDTGAHIYHSACITCHGTDGTGTPKDIAGFAPPKTFPDFSRFDQTTAEPNTPWKDVIIHGAPPRRLSPVLPSLDAPPPA